MIGPLDVLKFFSKVKKGALVFDAKICVRYRSRDASCRICEKVCPESAIAWDKEDSVFDGILCSECGICVAACPVEALSLADLSPNTIARGVREAAKIASAQNSEKANAESISISDSFGNSDGTVLLVCRIQHDDADKLQAKTRASVIVDVKCAGSVGNAALLSLAISSGQKVAFVKDRCEGCKDRSGFENFESFCSTANSAMLEDQETPSSRSLFEIIDPGSVVKEDHIDPTRLSAPSSAPARTSLSRMLIRTDKGVSRREFFQKMQSNAVTQAGKAVSDRVLSISDQQLRDVRYENKVPITRELLVEVLGQSGTRKNKSMEDIAANESTIVVADETMQNIGSGLAVLLGIVKLDVLPACDLCFSCSDLCPTSALEEVAASGQKALKFSQLKCTGCMLCRDICHKHAVVIQKETSDIFLITEADENEGRILKKA